MTENRNRCVITGLGMVCAIGNSVDETWNNALKGVSGIKNTKTVDTEGCYATLAAEVHDNTLDECPHADEMTEFQSSALRLLRRLWQMLLTQYLRMRRSVSA